MIRKLLFLSALAFFTKATYAQIVMSTTGSYTQDFNTLSGVTNNTTTANVGAAVTWIDGVTIPGWYWNNSGSGEDYVPTNGSSSAGNRYSFCTPSGNATNSDRAMGAVGSGNAAAGNFAYGTVLYNASASTITSIQVAYRGEQWRRGGSGGTTIQTVGFYYKVVTTLPGDSSTILTPNDNFGWTNVAALDFTSPVTSGGASSLIGNNTGNFVTKSATALTGLSVPAGSYVIIKWDDPDHPSSDHGLAIDDVAINWTVPPSGCSGTPTGGTAAAAPANLCIGASTVLTLSGATSSAGITRQWQSSPDSMAWTDIPSGGTGTTYNATPATTTYYRCMVTCTNGGASAGSAGVKVTVDQLPSVTVDPVGQTICATQPIMLQVTATGNNLTYQWRKNGSNVPGTAADYLQNNTTIADAGDYDVIVSSGTCRDTSAAATVVVNPLGATLPDTGTTVSYVQADGVAYTFTDGSCRPIASVTDAGGGNVLGNVGATVTVDGSVQAHNGQPYLQRHYEIAPASNGTATVKIFVLQSEFDAYNANTNGFPALPTGPSDAAGISNIAITAFHGLPGDGTTGPGGQYDGAQRELVMPSAITTVWNAANNWWELSFTVSGFSGFFIHGNTNFPLHVSLQAFSGRMTGAHTAQLDWSVNQAAPGDRFTVEKSTDGKSFHAIAEIGAHTVKQYSYMDVAAMAAVNYYRLRLHSSNGSESLSQTIALQSGRGQTVQAQLIPNPARDRSQLRITAHEAGHAGIRINDLAGRTVRQHTAVLGEGANTIELDLSGLVPGQYTVMVEASSGGRQVLQLSKL